MVQAAELLEYWHVNITGGIFICLIPIAFVNSAWSVLVSKVPRDSPIGLTDLVLWLGRMDIQVAETALCPISIHLYDCYR